MRQLDAREQRFLDEYLVDLDTQRAAIAAGYAKTTANSKAFTWVSDSKSTKPHLFQAIQKAKKERAERVKVDADYVLQRLAAIDRMKIADILDPDGNVLPMAQWPDICQEMVGGQIDPVLIGDPEKSKQHIILVLSRMKWPNKQKNLELLGKHVTVKAFSDRIGHQHGLTDEAAISIKDILKRIDGQSTGIRRPLPSGDK